MNDETYKLRKAAMKYIYMAKDLLKKNGIDMPRISIRITDTTPENHQILGSALMNKKYIWIPAKSIEGKYDLHEIVFHELLHAVYGVRHDESDLLMGKYHKGSLGAAKVNKLFLKHALEAERENGLAWAGLGKGVR